MILLVHESWATLIHVDRVKSAIMTIKNAIILSVNVGTPKEFEYKRRTAKSAIWKSPVEGRVMAKGINLIGDDQADREAHGGFDKAIYAYAKEDLDWWEKQIGKKLEFGVFGENLTTEGIEVNDALIGERWAVGGATLEVSEPRIPCWRLGVRMEDNTFPKKFTKALRPGPYLRLIEEGEIGAKDEIRVIKKPDHDLTVRDVFRIYTKDRSEVARILKVSQISEAWKKWASKELEKANSQTTKNAEPGCC